MRDTCRPSGWIVSSSVRRPWMCAMAAPALTASIYCCAHPGDVLLRRAQRVVRVGRPRVAGDRDDELFHKRSWTFARMYPLYPRRGGSATGSTCPDRPARTMASNTDMPWSTSSIGTGYGCAITDRARECGELGVEHVEAGVLAGLVGRGRHRAGRRMLRRRHEAQSLQSRL